MTDRGPSVDESQLALARLLWFFKVNRTKPLFIHMGPQAWMVLQGALQTAQILHPIKAVGLIEVVINQALGDKWHTAITPFCSWPLNCNYLEPWGG